MVFRINLLDKIVQAPPGRLMKSVCPLRRSLGLKQANCLASPTYQEHNGGKQCEKRRKRMPLDELPQTVVPAILVCVNRSAMQERLDVRREVFSRPIRKSGSLCMAHRTTSSRSPVSICFRPADEVPRAAATASGDRSNASCRMTAKLGRSAACMEIAFRISWGCPKKCGRDTTPSRVRRAKHPRHKHRLLL